VSVQRPTGAINNMSEAGGAAREKERDSPGAPRRGLPATRWGCGHLAGPRINHSRDGSPATETQPKVSNTSTQQQHQTQINERDVCVMMMIMRSKENNEQNYRVVITVFTTSAPGDITMYAGQKWMTSGASLCSRGLAANYRLHRDLLSQVWPNACGIY
jgi:hypothetical protein